MNLYGQKVSTKFKLKVHKRFTKLFQGLLQMQTKRKKKEERLRHITAVHLNSGLLIKIRVE